ncbi:ABC transporter substrate-binding protein [Paenibacillus glycinis]|uniref:Solute-binding protein n=1 Tax=Paenibacillus glycinis TaxID=2697035 RepID=A0ABW9XJF4_9BACL|nr:ABC transporter substrate-binding protein [Paenibacillus glycinis]NBD22723.1 solute-binding protein [Paenibacillus glycinis]
MRKQLTKGIMLLAVMLTTVSLAACTKANDNGSNAAANENGGNAQTNANAEAPAELSVDELASKAKEQGEVVSVGMPDSWANWKDTWADMDSKYGLKHTDTDMSSAEEIAKFEAEKDKATADIGDVGIAFGPVAAEKGVTQPYKTSYWDEIPSWAKDADGNWVVGYQGTIAFMVNKDLVKDVPKSWDDLLKGDYKIAVGDVTKAAQAQMSVLAASIAMGGDEKNIQPGVDFFKKLAEQNRISSADVTTANFEKGEIPVGLLWDFNALGYRDQINPDQFEVVIPSEGSVVSGYATIINKFAPHPEAAKLTREYILSDAGQINLAKGFARPIRDSVKLPDDVSAKLIPLDQYKNAKPISDYSAWDETAKKLPQLWQDNVLIHLS